MFRKKLALISFFALILNFGAPFLAHAKEDYTIDKAFSISKEFGYALKPGSGQIYFYVLVNFGGGSVDIWSVFPDALCFDNVPQRQSGSFDFQCDNGSAYSGNFNFVGAGIIRTKLSLNDGQPETYIINLNKRFNKDEIFSFYQPKGTSQLAKNEVSNQEDKDVAVLKAQLEQERLAREKAEQEAAAAAAKKAEQQKQQELATLQAQLEQERLAREKAEQEAAAAAAKKAEQQKQQELATLQAQLEQERLAREKAEQAVVQQAEIAKRVDVPRAIVKETEKPDSEGGSIAANAKWQQAKTPQQAQLFVNEVQSSIVMYMAIAEVIEKQPPSLKERVLSIVKGEITRLSAEKEKLQKLLTQRFSTPIRPTNANLQVSAFRAADTFPKIPFYVPGTNEIGEMLAVPRITDEGYLEYQFDFLDPVASFEKVRERISIGHEDINTFIDGLFKVDEWTIVAQENGLTRRFEKTAGCIPAGACEEKRQGVASTEIIFQVYEDGSTAGRIQRNKGLFSVGYNMSVESSILLSAYLTYMREAGSKEFNIGVMSDKQVDALFE